MRRKRRGRSLHSYDTGGPTQHEAVGIKSSADDEQPPSGKAVSGKLRQWLGRGSSPPNSEGLLAGERGTAGGGAATLSLSSSHHHRRDTQTTSLKKRLVIRIVVNNPRKVLGEKVPCVLRTCCGCCIGWLPISMVRRQVHQVKRLDSHLLTILF